MPIKNTVNGIKACVFDAYGTLFDVHSAVGKHGQDLGDKADQVSVLWRTKQLEYTWLRSLMGHHAGKIVHVDPGFVTSAAEDLNHLADRLTEYAPSVHFDETRTGRGHAKSRTIFAAGGKHRPVQQHAPFRALGRTGQ